MLNDTPTPSSSGKAIMLAKLSGRGRNTITSTVIVADRSSGAMTITVSRTRRSAINRITVIASTADTAAERNAPMIVALVASIVTAVPPAFGATRVTWSTNWRRPGLVRGVDNGNT